MSRIMYVIEYMDLFTSILYSQKKVDVKKLKNQDSDSVEDQRKITLFKCRTWFRAIETKIERWHLQILVGAL